MLAQPFLPKQDPNAYQKEKKKKDHNAGTKYAKLAVDAAQQSGAFSAILYNA